LCKLYLAEPSLHHKDAYNPTRGSATKRRAAGFRDDARPNPRRPRPHARYALLAAAAGSSCRLPHVTASTNWSLILMHCGALVSTLEIFQYV